MFNKSVYTSRKMNILFFTKTNGLCRIHETFYGVFLGLNLRAKSKEKKNLRAQEGSFSFYFLHKQSVLVGHNI